MGSHLRLSFGLIVLLAVNWSIVASEPDLSDYRTIDKVITAKVAPAENAVVGVPAYLGVELGLDASEHLVIRDVAADSPAAKVGLKRGDLVVSVDGKTLPDEGAFRQYLLDRSPGNTIEIAVTRQGKEQVYTATLAPLSRPVARVEAPAAGDKKGGGWDTRGGNLWKKPTYQLAVICIEYPDQKHNSKITSQAWDESLFSHGTYVKKKSITGQDVFGSMFDFYFEQSYGKMSIEGKAFDFVEVSKKRDEYAKGKKDALFGEAVEKLLAREGKDALAKYEGIFFLYAGKLPQGTTRGGGSLYWPHRGSFTHKDGKRWPYFIVGEGGDTMANISVFCHEFGHMLGLPDLYARPEAPGLEGLGNWCLMSNQVGAGKPQHASAWCKERLGWIEPAVIDPTVKQKIILSPIEDSHKDCLKVLIQKDGSEYLLLENRIHKGFDKSLPGEGLLIWRVVKNYPFLVGSHGIEGPTVSRVFPKAVPYPSEANDALTPYTMPSSRSKLGGGPPIYITNIRRLPDGRVTLHIGYEYQ
jgi:M6 family metalloprotease-like protein